MTEPPEWAGAYVVNMMKLNEELIAENERLRDALKVEGLAGQICAYLLHRAGYVPDPWHKMSEPARQHYRKVAREELAGMEAGHAG